MPTASRAVGAGLPLSRMKWNWLRPLTVLLGCLMLVTLLGAYVVVCSYVYLAPALPSIEVMRNVDLQVPLRVYTRSGALIAQIGEQRRSMPDGLVTLRISPETGTLVSAENPEGIPKMFMVNHLPAANETGNLAPGPEGQASSEPIF